MGERQHSKPPCYGEVWDSYIGNIRDEAHHWWFMGCPACGEAASLRTYSPDGHKVMLTNNIITVSPSIGCPFCNAHYFVREATIVAA